MLSSFILKVETDNLKKQDNYNTVYKDFAAKSKLEPEEGGFKNQEEANKFLMDGLFDIDPKLARELEKEYKTHELAGITHEGTVLKQKAMLAMQKGGVDGLAKEIDEMNGVDVMVKVTRDGDIVTLDEVTPDGKYIRTIASGDEKTGEFMKNLDMTLDPANMMATAKDYYDTLKAQADVAYTEASTEYKKQQTQGLINTKAEFDKDDFFIKMLIENPEDKMAWMGLVGMDMSIQEIEEAIVERKSLNALDNASNGDGSNGDGSNDALTVELDAEEKELNNAQAIVERHDQGVIKEGIGGSTVAIDNARDVVESNTYDGLTAQIVALEAEIKALGEGRQTLGKGKLRKEKEELKAKKEEQRYMLQEE